jgi:hypothetical protein
MYTKTSTPYLTEDYRTMKLYYTILICRGNNSKTGLCFKQTNQSCDVNYGLYLNDCHHCLYIVGLVG